MESPMSFAVRISSYVLKYLAHVIDNSLKQEDCPGQFIGL